jgi:signal transduction histidine kinase
VLKQILDNACKYTEHGHIDVYCHKSSEHAVITVKDTGAGMSQESVRHIFDRFYKGNSFVPGTGLGMSVVKGLVTLWNGTIKVDSEQHVGTSVTFTIPLHASFYQNRTQREFTHGKPLSVL